MKKFLLSLAVVFALVGCGSSVERKKPNPFEAGTEILVKATKEIKSAANEDEVAVIVERAALALDSIDKSEEWQVFMRRIEGNDSLFIKEIAPSRAAMDKAVNDFADAVVAATSK